MDLELVHTTTRCGKLAFQTCLPHCVQNTLGVWSAAGVNIFLTTPQTQIANAERLLSPALIVPQYHVIWCSAFLKRSACMTFLCDSVQLQSIQMNGLKINPPWVVQELHRTIDDIPLQFRYELALKVVIEIHKRELFYLQKDLYFSSSSSEIYTAPSLRWIILLCLLGPFLTGILPVHF